MELFQSVVARYGEQPAIPVRCGGASIGYADAHASDAERGQLERYLDVDACTALFLELAALVGERVALQRGVRSRGVSIGHSDAQYEAKLGTCYALVEKDEAKAARLYEQAAEQGEAPARRSLGWCYERGQGMRQDASAAVEQYRLAVEGGCADANASLGLCFEKGRGVPRSDPVEAARLYALAAEGDT
jgi:TPR repeat protein